MSRSSSFAKSFFVALCLCGAILLFSVSAMSQDASTGALRGIISDSSGGRISTGSVVLVNSATSMRYSAFTDDQGQYAFQLIPPGDYIARAESHGMSAQVSPLLKIEVGAAAELNFTLAI